MVKAMVAGHGLGIVAAALILLAYRYDMRRRLALAQLLAAVAIGFAAMWSIGWADDSALLRTHADGVLVKAALIALIEEGGKLACIVLLAHTLFSRRLTTPLDGLLLGQMVGLGMALNESMLYLRLEPQTLQTLGMEIVRLFAHSLMAGVIGFGVGCTRLPAIPAKQAWHCLLLCAGLTTGIHFTWNALAYGRGAGVPAHLIPMILMLTLMLLWKTFCNIAQRHSGDAWPITIAPLRTA